MILLYTSPDLRHWTYLHPLVEGTASNAKAVNPVDNGEMWECPDFFPLRGPKEEKHVLLISTMGRVLWKVGTYAKQRFTPEKEGVVDWGAYYAAKTMLDAKGKRILWGWIPEKRPDADLLSAGWAGVMSLPRTLSLTPQNELATTVIAAGVLRSGHTGAHLALYEIGPEAPKETLRRKDIFDSLRIHDLAAELALIIYAKGNEFTLRLESEDGASFATISWITQPGHRELRVNSVTAPLAADTKASVHLHLFLDGSVLEVFANEGLSDDGIALTARIYRVPSGPLRLKLEGNAEIVSFEAWRMKPISKDRLTGSMCS
jgi:beta-fructofuranosidase